MRTRLLIFSMFLLTIGVLPAAAGPYISQCPCSFPGVGHPPPTPPQVPGKEFASGPNVSVSTGVAVPTPGQSQLWDGVGGVKDGQFYPGGEVDAMANLEDALFSEVVLNQAHLLFSGYGMTGLPAVLMEGEAPGDRGIWASGASVSQDLKDSDDIVGLEVWGPEAATDANRYSLVGDPGGCSVNIVGGGCLVTTSELDTFLGLTNLDLDALMVQESTNRILFSIRATGPYDGGEIFVYNYLTDTAAGNCGPGDVNLFHGGHCWDTAYNVLADWRSFGMTSEDVSVLEAIDQVPEPGTLMLVVGGMAVVARRKIRRRR